MLRGTSQEVVRPGNLSVDAEGNDALLFIDLLVGTTKPFLQMNNELHYTSRNCDNSTHRSCKGLVVEHPWRTNERCSIHIRLPTLERDGVESILQCPNLGMLIFRIWHLNSASLLRL
jgi:hypothetical protein